MTEEANGETKPEKAKSSPVVLIVVIALMSVVAVGAGYGVSSVFKGASLPASAKAENAKPDSHEGGHGSAKNDGHGKAEEGHGGGHGSGSSSVVKLDPVIVTLPKNDNSWLRLELALVLDSRMEMPEEHELVQITSDVSGLLRTMDLQHISRPSGYIHLKEDLLDRARMTSGEAIRDVMIVSLVAE